MVHVAPCPWGVFLPLVGTANSPLRSVCGSTGQCAAALMVPGPPLLRTNDDVDRLAQERTSNTPAFATPTWALIANANASTAVTCFIGV